MTEPEQKSGTEAGRRSAFGDPDASLIDQMGGIRGLVFSSIPILAFVPVNQIWGLQVAIWSALGVAVAMLVKRPSQPAHRQTWATLVSSSTLPSAASCSM